MAPLYYLRLSCGCILLLAWSMAAQAQRVELDFQTKQINKIGEFKRATEYPLVIKNINLLLYKINVVAKDTVTTAGLTVPAFSNLGLTELSTLSASLGALGGIVAAAGGGQEEFVDEGEERVTRSPYNPSEYASDFDRPSYPASFARRVKRDFGNTITAAESESIASLLLVVYNLKQQEYYQQLIDQRNDIEGVITEYNGYVTYAGLQVGNPKPVDNIKLDNLNTRIVTLRNSIITTEKSAIGAYSNYAAISSQYATIIGKNLKADDEKLKLTHQELMKATEAAKATISAANVRLLNEALVVLINNQDRTYTSFPFQLTKSQSLLKISVIPRDEKSMLQSYSTTLLFPIDTKRFWGVSSGFYISSLHNQAFSVRTILDSPQDTTAQYSLVSEKPGKAEVGVNAMIRYGWHKPNKKVGFQLGFGPGLAISDKVRPRLMAGIGPVFGDNHKFIIDLGIIAGYVERRSTVYAQDGPYYAVPGKTTVSQLRAGGYLSLNYLFLAQ